MRRKRWQILHPIPLLGLYVFEEGVPSCQDNVTWARLVPHLAFSAWRSRIVHESHRWVTVGGKPDDILQAIHGWGFADLVFRRWVLIWESRSTYTSMQCGKRRKSVPTTLPLASLCRMHKNYVLRLVYTLAVFLSKALHQNRADK